MLLYIVPVFVFFVSLVSLDQVNSEISSTEQTYFTDQSGNTRELVANKYPPSDILTSASHTLDTTTGITQTYPSTIITSDSTSSSSNTVSSGSIESIITDTSNAINPSSTTSDPTSEPTSDPTSEHTSSSNDLSKTSDNKTDGTSDTTYATAGTSDSTSSSSNTDSSESIESIITNTFNAIDPSSTTSDPTVEPSSSSNDPSKTSDNKTDGTSDTTYATAGTSDSTSSSSNTDSSESIESIITNTFNAIDPSSTTSDPTSDPTSSSSDPSKTSDNKTDGTSDTTHAASVTPDTTTDTVVTDGFILTDNSTMDAISISPSTTPSTESTASTSESTTDDATESTTVSATELNTEGSSVPTTVSTTELNTEGSSVPTTVSTTELNTDSTPEATSVSTTESNTEGSSASVSTTESITDGTSESTTVNTTELNTDSTPESTSVSTTESNTEGSSVSTSVSTTESITDSTSESTTVNTTESTTDSGTMESTTDDTTESTTNGTLSSTESTTVSTTESTTVSTTESTTVSTTESTTVSTTESITETTEYPTTPGISNGVAVEIVAGILGILLLGGLLATGAVMYRRGKLPWNPKNSHASVRPQPISISKFENHCNQLLETPARLGSEYQLLLTLSTDVTDTNTFAAAQLPDNKKKNRYVNILPYDLTRVKLDITNDDPSSDYINASFIKGISNTIEYIASQGPKEETVPDFWRMVYQHDVQIIVMVTNLEEGGKVKCDPYLPKLREQLFSGDLIVRCGTELHFPMHTQRTIVLHKDDKKRNITHLHFNEWPDFGCPEGTDSMLQFCRTLRHHVSISTSGLILVHCSAGVGRTGTLIAIDILLQHIQESKKVDVFGTVFKLRKQRTNMVQTMGQYAYIYKCIRDAVRDPSFLKPDNSPSSSLEPIYENVPTKLTTFFYEKLPQIKAKSTVSSESECEL